MDQSCDMFVCLFVFVRNKSTITGKKLDHSLQKQEVMETTPEQMMEGIMLFVSRICISNQPPIFQNTVYNNFDHALCFCQIIC